MHDKYDKVILAEIDAAQVTERDYLARSENAPNAEKKAYWAGRAREITIKIAKLQSKIQHVSSPSEPTRCGCNDCVSSR
jgi:hypothetical protein